LKHWRGQGRLVFLITNAPRPALIIRTQLDRLGLERSSYDAVVTSGDTAIAALKEQGVTSVGFIGTAADREALADEGLELLSDQDGADVACIGLPAGTRDLAGQDAVLRAMLVRGARLHCFNPDRVVQHGDTLELCAGAIADMYEAMGGQVCWYGKPYPAVYRRCLEMAAGMGASLSSERVIAVGDSLATDFLGAAQMGFAFVFVTHGIEAGKVEEFGAAELVRSYAAEQNLDVEPLVMVRELG
jgi:HAD superfamily hydrolase (TIGR01459 family)